MHPSHFFIFAQKWYVLPSGETLGMVVEVANMVMDIVADMLVDMVGLILSDFHSVSVSEPSQNIEMILWWATITKEVSTITKEVTTITKFFQAEAFASPNIFKPKLTPTCVFSMLSEFFYTKLKDVTITS